MNIPWIKKVRIKDVEVHESEPYKEERIGTIEFPDRLTDCNAFTLANTVSEIYFPIDFIADRASKIRYMITKNGIEVPNTELNRFVTSINPLFSFSDLVYQSVFAYLADGNMVSYRGIPSLYKSASVNSIDRIDVINPNDLDLSEYNNLSALDISSWNALIRRAKYTKANGTTQDLNIDNLVISNIDANKREDSVIFSKSPLYKAIRPINNLLAVYSARYNVYVNNGYAGLLVRKGTTSKDGLAEKINPSDKKAILADLNENGITGNRNRWGINGITGIPVEFINTLATIKDLLPMEETLENSVKIAGVYQIPSGMVPRKDQPTFDNQDGQERQVWENAIMSVCEGFAAYWTKVCTLDKAGYQITPDYSTVSCLQANQDAIEDTLTKELANIEKIKALYPEYDTAKAIKVILEKYGKG
jgi:hypothetical protein